MLVKLLREGLGRAFILVSNLTLPKQIERSATAQTSVNEACKALSLYQFYACPFCLKVRRQIHRLNLPMVYKDAQNDPEHRQDLEKLGGKIQVPCLRIQAENQTDVWLFESDAVIRYLDERFGEKKEN